jgi:hypothetical protein
VLPFSRSGLPKPLAALVGARDERPAGEQEAGTEGKEGEVPSERAAEVIAHVVNPEQLVVDQPLDQVAQAPARQEQPQVRAPGRREPPVAPSVQSSAEPAATQIQVARWKSPSARVLASSPATVVIGWPLVDVSMWCHCSTWAAGCRR